MSIVEKSVAVVTTTDGILVVSFFVCLSQFYFIMKKKKKKHPADKFSVWEVEKNLFLLQLIDNSTHIMTIHTK